MQISKINLYIFIVLKCYRTVTLLFLSFNVVHERSSYNSKCKILFFLSTIKSWSSFLFFLLQKHFFFFFLQKNIWTLLVLHNSSHPWLLKLTTEVKDTPCCAVFDTTTTSCWQKSKITNFNSWNQSCFIPLFTTKRFMVQRPGGQRSHGAQSSVFIHTVPSLFCLVNTKGLQTCYKIGSERLIKKQHLCFRSMFEPDSYSYFSPTHSLTLLLLSVGRTRSCGERWSHWGRTTRSSRKSWTRSEKPPRPSLSLFDSYSLILELNLTIWNSVTIRCCIYT